MLSNCGAVEALESLGQQGNQTSQSQRESTLNIHWKDWCWTWNSITLATWYKELTHWKSPWCWERLRVGEEGVNRGWDGWMASPTWCTWVWANSGKQRRTGTPGVLQSMGSQRAAHNCATELTSWQNSKDSGAVNDACCHWLSWRRWSKWKPNTSHFQGAHFNKSILLPTFKKTRKKERAHEMGEQIHQLKETSKSKPQQCITSHLSPWLLGNKYTNQKMMRGCGDTGTLAHSW